MSRLSTRELAVALLLVTLTLAGVVSYYASSAPDGLSRVADDTGFASTGNESAATASPLAGYETAGVEDQRVSGGLAGVVGVLVVLGAASGVTHAVRRRASASARERH